MFLLETRAQGYGLDTKKLRRHAKSRLARIRKAAIEIEAQWDATDGDPMIQQHFVEFERAVQELETNIAESCEYYDEEVGT